MCLSWTVGEQTGDRERHLEPVNLLRADISTWVGAEDITQHKERLASGQSHATLEDGISIPTSRSRDPATHHHQQTRAGSSTERPAVCCARAGSPQKSRQTQRRCDTQQHSCRATTRVLSLTAHTCRRAHNSTHSDRPGLALLGDSVHGRTAWLQEQVQLQQLSGPFMTHKGR